MRSSPRVPASGASPYAQTPGSVAIGTAPASQQSKGSASPRLFPALHQRGGGGGNQSAGSQSSSLASFQQMQQGSPASSPERGGGHGHSGGQGHSGGGEEWLNSPRTHRMLQLLGVTPSTSSHASQSTTMVRGASGDAPQLSPHPPSAKPLQLQQQQQQPYSPYSPRSARGGDGSLEEKQEWRDGTLDDSYGSLGSAQQPKMFLPVSGNRRYYRANSHTSAALSPSPPASSRTRNNGPRRTGAAAGGIPPPGPTYGALTVFSPAAHTNAPASISPSNAAAIPPPQFTDAERQLVLDYLTSDTCGLFTPPSDDEDAPEEQRSRQDITEAHLDALLSLCSDAPSVIRQLRSLDRQHLRFADIFALLSGVGAIVARKSAMLLWMLGQDSPEAGHQECHLFGQSPFVVFLNAQAMDRLVEESCAWKLGKLPPPPAAVDPDADPSSPAPPPPQPPQQLPTQPFDDVFHILLRLNESSSKQGEFHYFSQLIAHVRRVVEGVLATQGFPVDSAGTHGHAAHHDAHQLHEETPRFKRVGGKAPSSSTRAGAAAAAAAVATPGRSRAKMPLRGPSARSLLASPTYGKKAAAATASASPALAPPPLEEQREFNPSDEELLAAGDLGEPASPAAEKRARGPAPNLVASLRAAVSAFLSSPECGIFLDFNALLQTRDPRTGRMGPRLEAQAELDELIHCLLRAANNSSNAAADGQAENAKAEEQCLQTLQYISQHRSTVYASIPALVAALKSGLIDGASAAGGEETTAIQALMTKKRAKKKPVVAAAAAAAKKTLAPSAALPATNVHADLDSKKSRLALLAYLTQGAAGAGGGSGGGGKLIQPRPEPAALYAEILAQESIPSDTLDKLRRIERENHAASSVAAGSKAQALPHPVFCSFSELLAYTESMPSAADGAGEASTKQSVHAFLSSPGCLLFGAPRSSPTTAAAGGLASPSPPATSAGPGGLKMTSAQTARVIEEGGAGALTLQHLRAMESEGSVFPSVDDMITALQTRHIEHLLKKQRHTLGAAYPLAPHGGVSIETAIEMDAAAAASGRSLGAAQVALNMQRRAVWDFLHDVSCVLVPPHYPWTIEQVEQMVDTLLPLCAAGERASTVVAMLQEENARLESRAADPYASSALLVEALLSARHSLVPSASTASLSSADLDGELHANIAEFLSVAGRSLLHGLELFDEDISELVAAGGPDCLLFLWELHEADRSFHCVNPDLTSALARKRLDQSQQEKSWARVVLLRLKKEAAPLFGGFEAQKRVLDDLSLQRIERLAILQGQQDDEPDIAAHPAIVLTHLDALIYHAGVAHKLYASFADLETALHAGLRSEMMLQQAVVRYLTSVPNLFRRPASHVTATQVAQLFEWSRGGHRMLEYLTALCGGGDDQPPWTLFNFFHDLTHAVRSVHAGMKSAYARGDAQMQWNETPFSGAFALAPDSLPQAVYYPRFNAESFEALSGPERRMAWARTSSRPQRHVEQRTRRMDAGTRFWRERFEEFETEVHMPSEECVLSSGVRASRAQPPAWLAAEREASANLLLLLDPFPLGPLPVPAHLRPEPALVANVHVSPSIRAQQDALPASAWWDPLESAAIREARAFKRLQAAQGPNGPQLRLGRISGLQRMQLSRIEDHHRDLHMTTAAAAAGAADSSIAMPVVRMKPEVDLMSDVLVSPSRLVFASPPAAAAASAGGASAKSALITRRFLVRNDDLETTFLAQLLLDGDGKYTVTSANPQYLAPGGTASFIVEFDPDRASAPPDWDKTASVVPTGTPLAAIGLHVETGESVNPSGKRAPMPGEATIHLVLKPVLDDEPLHFTAEDLWALNPHRVAQTGAVARCMMDRTGGAAAAAAKAKQQAKSNARTGASPAPTSRASPASSVASPASMAAAEPTSKVSPVEGAEVGQSSGVSASSIVASTPTDASEVPSSDDPTQAEIDAVAKKRRAKRMTQAVDIHQIRNSGLLKSKLPPEENQPAAAMSASSSSSSSSAAAPGEVVASFSQMPPSSPLAASTRRADFAAAAAAAAAAGSDAPPQSSVAAASPSSPLVIAAMDSAFAATDPATKRKMKRATQAISGLAEHVRLAASAKAAALASGSASAPVTARSSLLSASDSSTEVPASASTAGITSSPVSIAAMDSQIATLTAAEKRKAKRSTQSVDPLLAASLLNRKLLAQPADAVNTVSSSPSSSPAASPAMVPQSAVTAHPSSAVAIAAADESTTTAMGAMTPVERRRVKRATTITSDVAPTMSPLRTGGRSVASSPEMAPGSSDSPPPMLTLGITAYESQSGAVAVAHADTQVNAMSARERNRSKRMTQALHDASYDPSTARAQRIADENDPVALAKTASIERDKVRGAMAALRATPRLAAACTPQLPSSAESWIVSDLFAAYRCDTGRRLKAERENDHESFPPRFPTPPESTRAMTYFVQGLGSIAVSHPSGLTLHPHTPLPIKIENVSANALVLFALASDEEYVLHTPTPVFLAPGATFLLQVSCEAPHLPGAELGLVVKPLLPGEDTVAAGSASASAPATASAEAKIFWDKHPYRIMQKVHVPLECVALQRSAQQVAQAAAQTAGPAAQQASSSSLSPSASSSGLDEAGRPKRAVRNDRVSGSDYTYPGASKEDQKRAADAAAAAATAASAATSPVAAAPTQPVSADAVPSASAPEAASRLAVAASVSSPTSVAFDSYRQDAAARIIHERHATYPDYVHRDELTQGAAGEAVRTDPNSVHEKPIGVGAGRVGGVPAP